MSTGFTRDSSGVPNGNELGTRGWLRTFYRWKEPGPKCVKKFGPLAVIWGLPAQKRESEFAGGQTTRGGVARS